MLRTTCEKANNNDFSQFYELEKLFCNPYAEQLEMEDK